MHVPLALPGERLMVEAQGDRGRIITILEASAERIEPVCTHFGECGGCALQHWSAGPYLAWKAERIRLALARVQLETEILSPFAAPPKTRRRVALHARRSGSRIVLGFKGRRSWRVIPIRQCAIAVPAIVSALPALAKLAEPFLEHPASAPILHVTATLTGLDIDVSGIERKSGGLSADARRAIAEIAHQADLARVTLAGEMLYQARQPEIRTGEAVVQMPPGAFLQAVPDAEAAMVRFALEVADGARKIADLYCGLGAFSFPLARIAPVMAADVSAPAIAALTRATGTTPGLKPIAATARDLDRRPVSAGELAGVDVVLFDPPRAGAEAQAREIARSRTPRVIGVSCNPTTFARDARILADAGFDLVQVLPVDQFLWSPHIEMVGNFSREQV
ncbi:MAG TPA: RNA methyltransferase [Caulobacteraceae bacterium]